VDKWFNKYPGKLADSRERALKAPGKCWQRDCAGKGTIVWVSGILIRIRGGHTDYNLRISSMPVASIANHVDVLIALDQETTVLCAGELSKGGLLVADEQFAPVLPAGVEAKLLSAPLTVLATQSGNGK